MKIKKSHMCRRIILFVTPIVIGSAVAFTFCNHIGKAGVDSANMIEVSKVMIGVWGTLLGFIITAESIMIAFGNGTITGEFKQTGHYMTVIFQYTQTSMKLLCYILVFVCIIVNNSFGIMEMFVFVAFTVMTFIDILLSLVILILMLKMANE